MNRVLLCGAALAALLASPAPAQSTQAAPENPLAACARIEDDQARLRCFDLAVRGGADAGAEGAEAADATAATGAPTETQAAEETRRFGLPRPSNFAFGLPDMSLPSVGRADGEALNDAASSNDARPNVQVVERDDDGDPSKILLIVDRVSTFGYSTKRFHMTNGQIWEVTDGMRVRIPRSDPLTAEIRVAGMGGYFLRLNGEGRAMRVRRID